MFFSSGGFFLESYSFAKIFFLVYLSIYSFKIKIKLFSNFYLKRIQISAKRTSSNWAKRFAVQHAQHNPFQTM